MCSYGVDADSGGVVTMLKCGKSAKGLAPISTPQGCAVLLELDASTLGN